MSVEIVESAGDKRMVDWALAVVEESVSKYYKAAGSVGWDTEAKRRELEDPSVRFLVALADSTQIAFAAYIPDTREPAPGEYARARPRRHDRVLYVLELHVLAGYRGRGTGRALMAALEERARAAGHTRRVVLTCFVGNKDAWRLYTDGLAYRVDYLSADYGILSKLIS